MQYNMATLPTKQPQNRERGDKEDDIEVARYLIVGNRQIVQKYRGCAIPDCRQSAKSVMIEIVDKWCNNILVVRHMKRFCPLIGM